MDFLTHHGDMKTIIIKITRAGTRIGPFDVYDHLGNVIASNISRGELIEGITLIVEDNVTSVKLKSIGKCTDEQTKKVGVVAPYQLVQESVFTNIACLWKHHAPTVFNEFYGNIEPYILEQSLSFEYHDQIFQNAKDYSRVFVYNTDEAGEFSYTGKIEVDNRYFNKMVVYNNQQSSGMITLVPKPKNNLREYMKYPIYNTDSKTMLFTKSDNFYNVNGFFDVVKDKTKQLFVTSCENFSLDKIVNQENMVYTHQSFRKSPLRAKEIRVRYILDNFSDIHIVSQLFTTFNQISYK